MPGFDGMGSMGMGPGTGGRRGGRPGFFGRWSRGFGWGRGRGFDRGFGRGSRGRFWAGGSPAWGWGGPDPWGAPTREAEISRLREEAEMLKAEMEAVQGRIDELAPEEVS